MSDFIFSSIHKSKGELSAIILSIYQKNAPSVSEYYGDWGSLCVTRNIYSGFQPFETDEHICVMIGGPVLYFRNNSFLMEDDTNAGTKAIYDRWRSGKVQWDEDLSGPFVFFLIDKVGRQIVCVTDLMMFIPVYKCEKENDIMIATHVDALAKTAKENNAYDPVSIIDFISSGVVTFLYSVYLNIRQCHPAAVHLFELHGKKGYHNPVPEPYWIPEEKNTYKSIDEASDALRKGLEEYIGRATENMDTVAHFISGGEDSRTVCGMLPKKLKRDAFIFLDNMNREGRIAQKVAQAYGSSFHAEFRSKTHYLDILPEASQLIGSGQEYQHTHSLRFHEKCKLWMYSAVFGGFLSDTFIKADHVIKFKYHYKFPFLPQIRKNNCSYLRIHESRNIKLKNIFKEIVSRQNEHLDNVLIIRPQSPEWFQLWPMTMHNDAPYFYSNRRLFRTYEPFMCKEAVKISAVIPVSWKLNRRIFNRMSQSFLRDSRSILHSDGRLPYYSFWLNIPVQFSVWIYRGIMKRTGFTKGNQGPWGDWGMILKSNGLNRFIKNNCRCSGVNNELISLIKSVYFKNNKLDVSQKIDIAQAIYLLSIKK